MERMWKEEQLLCVRTEENQAESQTGETVRRPTFKPSTSQIQVPNELYLDQAVLCDQMCKHNFT
jgi:hypothetical protein